LPPSVVFTVPASTSAVIVLSQLDRRSFRDVAGRSSWSMDFVLVKEGESEPQAKSKYSGISDRSVNLETTLTEGTYIVYVRLDQSIGRNEVCRSFSPYSSSQLIVVE